MLHRHDAQEHAISHSYLVLLVCPSCSPPRAPNETPCPSACGPPQELSSSAVHIVVQGIGSLLLTDDLREETLQPASVRENKPLGRSARLKLQTEPSVSLFFPTSCRRCCQASPLPIQQVRRPGSKIMQNPHVLV